MDVVENRENRGFSEIDIGTLFDSFAVLGTAVANHQIHDRFPIDITNGVADIDGRTAPSNLGEHRFNAPVRGEDVPLVIGDEVPVSVKLAVAGTDVECGNTEYLGNFEM